MYRDALAIRRELLGDEHADVARSLFSLGGVLQASGDPERAELLYREALGLRAEHLDLACVGFKLASLLHDRGDCPQAEPLLRNAVDCFRRHFSEGNWRIADVENVLGSCLIEFGLFAEAEPLLLESYPILKAKYGEQHTRTAEALDRIIDLYEAWRKPDKAAEWRTKLPAEPAD